METEKHCVPEERKLCFRKSCLKLLFFVPFLTAHEYFWLIIKMSLLCASHFANQESFLFSLGKSMSHYALINCVQGLVLLEGVFLLTFQSVSTQLKADSHLSGCLIRSESGS